MTTTPRRLLQWAILSFCCLWICQAVEAYILPARYYIRGYLKKRKSATKLRLWQTTTVWKGAKKTRYEERIYLNTPGKVRVERWVKGKRVQVDAFSGKSHLHWRKGQQSQSKKRKIQHRFDLFTVERAGSGFGSITNVLRWMRVRYRGVRKFSRDSDYLEQLHVRLTWFQKAPAVVLGSSPSSRGPNQVWLHKKQFYPMRFVGGAKHKPPHMDLRFLEYHIHAGVPLYPGRVELYRRGKLVRRSLVYRVKLVSSMSGSLFSKVP